MSDGEVREALGDAGKVIVRAVRDGLEHLPPELCSDIDEGDEGAALGRNRERGGVTACDRAASFSETVPT